MTNSEATLRLRSRADVAADAFDVIGPNGLVLELSRNDRGAYRLHGISGQSVADLHGTPLGTTPFTRWLEDHISEIDGPIPTDAEYRSATDDA